jgi:hypothetical protein
MSAVAVTKQAGVILVESPYNALLPRRARALSGTWDAGQKAWVFPRGAYEEVKDLYTEIYGYFETPSKTVAVLCVCKDEIQKRLLEIHLWGRPVARTWDDSDKVVYGAGVVIVSGGFYCASERGHGTFLEIEKGTALKLLDVPETLAKEMVDKTDNWLFSSFSIIDETLTTDKRDALIKERDALIKRLDEIEKELGTPAAKTRYDLISSPEEKCACGHTIPTEDVMSTSSGSSCFNCFDRMSL